MDWVDTEDIETDGDPFIVYFSPRHEVNQGDVVYDVSIPIKQDAEETDRIRVVDMIENKVLSGMHYGSTENIMDTYAVLVEVAQANNYDIIGSPKEVLIKNFYNCDDEKDFITEIQLPIMSKKELDLDKEVERLARKSNLNMRKSEYAFEKQLKKLDADIDSLVNDRIKDFDIDKKLTEQYLTIDYSNSTVDRYREKLKKI